MSGGRLCLGRILRQVRWAGPREGEMAAASSPSVSSLRTGVMTRESQGEQTKMDPCSPLEFSSWLMFETMVALLPEP